MKSYNQKYRVYYMFYHNDNYERFIKRKGIIVDVPGWGKVACECGIRGPVQCWNITDYVSGLKIDYIYCKNSANLIVILPAFIERAKRQLKDDANAQRKLEWARERAKEVPLLRRYIQKYM